MTALNAFVERDAVHIATDGATYRRDGRMHGYMNKTALMPHLNAAVANRGMAGTLAKLVTRLQGAETFDGMIDSLAARLAPVVMFDTFEAVIAGWSDRGGPEAYIVSPVRKFTRGVNITKIPMGDGYFAPSDAGLAERCERRGVRLDTVQPELDASLIMDAQRVAHDDRRFFNKRAVGVGGFCQLTTVTKDQTITRVLGGWPDAVGEVIQPALTVSPQ